MNVTFEVGGDLMLSTKNVHGHTSEMLCAVCTVRGAGTVFRCCSGTMPADDRA